MIGRLSGTLVAKHPPGLMIDVGGVGYELEAPMSTFYELPEAGKPVVLFTHYAVKEDAVALYGFHRESERLLFDVYCLRPGQAQRVRHRADAIVRPGDAPPARDDDWELVIAALAQHRAGR